MKRILIIEDEPDIALSLRYSLERSGEFEVAVAEDGESGLRQAEASSPDVVLLDLNLPDMDGMDVCRQLRAREEGPPVPIIMLTARVEERNMISGLDSGADDYITKPFSIKEVVARIRAVLRRARSTESEGAPLVAGPLSLDEGQREVRVDGSVVPLTRKEFDLLAELMRRRGLVLSRDKLLERVWGYGHPGETRTVDVHVRQLRKKLGERVAAMIETVVGVGYRMKRQGR